MQRRKRHSAPPITSTSPQELPEKHIAAPHSSDYPGNELAVGLVHVPRAIPPEQAPEVLCQASPGSVKRNGKRCAGRGVETSHPSFRYHVFVGKDSRTRTSIRNASCSPSAPAWISGEVASRCQEAPHGHVEASLQEQWGGSRQTQGPRAQCNDKANFTILILGQFPLLDEETKVTRSPAGSSMVRFITTPASDAGRPPCPPGADLGNRVSPATSSIHSPQPGAQENGLFLIPHAGSSGTVFCLLV